MSSCSSFFVLSNTILYDFSVAVIQLLYLIFGRPPFPLTIDFFAFILSNPSFIIFRRCRASAIEKDRCQPKLQQARKIAKAENAISSMMPFAVCCELLLGLITTPHRFKFRLPIFGTLPRTKLGSKFPLQRAWLKKSKPQQIHLPISGVKCWEFRSPSCLCPRTCRSYCKIVSITWPNCKRLAPEESRTSI